MKWNKALFIRNIEGLITKRFGGVQDRLNDEVDAASAAVRGCLESKVALVDDGTSDAMTIAQSLTSLCRNEFHEFAYIHIKNENPHVQQMFYDKIERSKDNLNTALVYVLKYRISQKEDQKGQGR